MVDITTALVLFGLLVATIWRPPVAFSAVVVTFALEQWAQASGSYFAQNSTQINYISGIIVLAGVISSVVRRKDILGAIDSVYIGILIFYGFAVLSLFWTSERQFSSSLLWTYAPYMVTYTLALPLIFADEDDFRVAIVATAVVGCFLVPALAFGTSIHSWGRTIETATAVVDRTGRERTRLTPLAVSYYGGAVVLSFLLGQVGKSSRLLGLLGWVIVPIGMYLIVRSGSRGQLIGTLFAGAALVKFSYPGLKLGRLMAWMVGLGSLVAFTYFAFSLLPSSTSRFNVSYGYDTYLNTRGAYVGQLMREWMTSSPLNVFLGMGVGASWALLGVYPHVQFVELLADLGLFGVAIAGTVFSLACWKALLSLQLSKHDLRMRGTLVAFMGFVLLNVLLSFKQGSYIYNSSLLMCLAIMSKTATVWGRARSRAERQKRQQWMRWQQTQAMQNAAMAQHG